MATGEELVNASSIKKWLNKKQDKVIYDATIDAGITAQDGDNYPDRPNNAKGTGTYFPNGRVSIENKFESIEKAYGHSYVKNQLLNKNAFPATQTVLGVTFTNNGDGSITINGTATTNADYHILNSYNYVANKKFLAYIGTDDIEVRMSTIGGGYGSRIFTYANNVLTSLYLRVPTGVTVSNVTVKPKYVDLTLLDQDLANTSGLTPEMVLKAYPNILNWDYDTGTMIDAEDFTYSSSGINLWDGTNDIINLVNQTYYCLGTANITYKDKSGTTISSESKTNATFIAPTNCYSFAISGTGNIQICLHYTDTTIENTYHPYVAPSTKLIKYYGGKGRSAGSVKDEVDYVIAKKRRKLVNQLVITDSMLSIRQYENIDYASLDLEGANLDSRGKDVTTEVMPYGRHINSYNDAVNIGRAVRADDNTIFFGFAKGTTLAQMKQVLVGKKVNYRLETPIEEDITDPTELNNILPCDDYGIESKSDGVIAGMKVSYVFDLMRTTSNNASNISALNEEIRKFPQIPSDASGKTYSLKLVNGVLTFVEETNV